MTDARGLAAAFGYGTDPAGDAARREHLAYATATEEEWRRRHDIAADWAVPDDPDPVPGHELSRERTPAGNVIVRCACGRWDGGWTGARSRRRVLDDHAAHVAAELAAAGPLHVTSVRADLHPEELEP